MLLIYNKIKDKKKVNFGVFIVFSKPNVKHFNFSL